MYDSLIIMCGLLVACTTTALFPPEIMEDVETDAVALKVRWAWRKTEKITQELRMEMDCHRQTEDEPVRVGSTESAPASQPKRRS